MFDLIIEDATIVSSGGRQVADIALKRGRIAYIGPRPMGRTRERVNAIGRFVMPGIIDTHVRFTSAEDSETSPWITESRAALTGGVTTIVEEPRVKNGKALAALRKRARNESRCNFGFWAPAGSRAQNEKMLDSGAVGLSVALDGSGRADISDAGLRELFQSTQAPLGFHVEDREVLAERLQALGAAAALNALRPPAAAAAGIQRLIALVREFDRPAHVFQLSTAHELQLMDPLGGELPITSAVSPSHLALSVDQNEELGDLLRSEPPIRTETDRRALWTALKRNRIDSIASAHTPHTRASKRTAEAQSLGFPGVETTFSMMLSAVQHGRISLERMVDLLAEAPARILGLKNKGRLEKGCDADLVLFSESDIARLNERSLVTRAGWSPFAGRELAPKPELVILGGRIAARSGDLVADDLRGTEITRDA